MLVKIGDGLVASARDEDMIDFWDSIIRKYDTESGLSYIAGWASAFTIFKDSGEWNGDNFVEPYVPVEENEGEESADAQKVEEDMNIEPEVKLTEWPVIDIKDLSTGLVSVPIKVTD